MGSKENRSLENENISLPRWLEKHIVTMEEHRGEKWERVEGGGWWFGGRFFRSPYVFAGLKIDPVGENNG